MTKSDRCQVASAGFPQCGDNGGGRGFSPPGLSGDGRSFDGAGGSDPGTGPHQGMDTAGLCKKLVKCTH